MATTTPLAYNPSASPIAGTSQVGTLAVGTSQQDYSESPGGVTWWMGPDEELGYVIAVPVSGNTQPTPLGSTWDANYVGTGNVLSSGNTVVTNNAVNASVLGTQLVDGNDKIMFSIRVNQGINGVIGFGQHDMNINSYVGSDNKSFGLNSQGEYLFYGAVQDSGLPSWGSPNDIIDVAIKLGVGSGIWFRVNGGGWNGTRNENPASGSSSLGVPIVNPNLYPGLTPYPVNIQGKATFLSEPVYSLPSGFTFIGGVFASVGFYRSTGLTDNSFVELTNQTFNQNFSSATDASVWLTTNGYWSSYPSPVLYLDAGNPASYPGSGNTWTDVIGGKTFNLINGPGYNSGNGGKIYFDTANDQYAQCNTSLPSLPQWSVSAWHYYTGENTGSSPCIVSEVYTGGAINYILGNGSDTSPDLQTGFWAPGWILTNNGYTLTPNNWYYIVGTYDGNTLSLYVNNTLVESTSGLVYTPQSSNAGIYLMTRWDNVPTELWGGYLSTVGIYDKPLTSGQVSSIWNSQKSRFGL
jgi:hypothetical protein